MQSEKKKPTKKDRVYQHVQNQMADQAAARAARKDRKEDMVGEKVRDLDSECFFSAKPGVVRRQTEAGGRGAGGEGHCGGCQG